MSNRCGLTRRGFVRSAVISAGAFAGTALVSRASGAPSPNQAEKLKIGIASYSLRKLDLNQTIQAALEAGVKYLTLKDVHLSLKSTPEQCAQARRLIEQAGLVLMGGGVINMNTAEEASGAFRYARAAGMPVVVCNPDPSLLDVVEREAKASGIRVAIHNHGPGDKRWPSPLTVLEQVRKRDSLMGICMDLGHTVRLDQHPVRVLRQCGDRLHDFHIKDIRPASADGKPVEVGRGEIDIPAVLRQLLHMKFSGHVALEYEASPENPLPGMRESFGYIRGVLAAL